MPQSHLLPLAEQLLVSVPRTMWSIRARFRHTPVKPITLNQMRVLARLIEKPFSNRGLADELNVGIPVMTRLIDRLVALRWVKRTVSTTDRRSVIIKATPLGARRFREANLQLAKHWAQELSMLNAHEQRDLQKGLTLLERLSRQTLVAACATLATLTTALYSPSPAHAAEIPALRLREVMNQALEKNPKVTELKLRVSEAESLRSAGLSLLLPTVAATLTATHRKDAIRTSGVALFRGEPYNLYDAQIQLTQPLYTGGGATSGLHVLDHEIAVRQYDLSILSRDTLVNSLNAYYSVHLAQNRVATLERTRKVMDQSLQTARERRKIGRGQLLDELQIRAQLANLASRSAQAQADLKTAAATLLQLISDQQNSELRLTPIDGQRDFKAARQYLAKARTQTSSRRPEFDRIGQLVGQQDERNTFNLSKYWPQFNFIASFGRNAYSKPDLFNDYSNTWSLALQLKIPIFNGLASVSEGRAYAEQLKQLDRQEAAIQNQAIYDETKANATLAASEAMIQASEDAFQLAQESVREAQRTYRLAMIDYLQFLSVQQGLLDAELSRDQAIFNYIQSVASYLVATGQSVADFIETLEKSHES